MSHQGVMTHYREWPWRVVKGVPSHQGGWRVVKGCRVVTESDLDESSRGDDSLQRVTLTSREGYAESSRRVTSRQGLSSHYREWPWRVMKGWWLVTEGIIDDSSRWCRLVTEGNVDDSSRGDDSWQRGMLTTRQGGADSSPPSLPPTWTLQASLSQLLWITIIPWHYKVKITSYHLCN